MSADRPLTADDIPWHGGPGIAPAAMPPLAETLREIEVFLRWYVVLTEHQAIVLALWVGHTHTIAAAECTPYLQVTSATKRSGKTRLLEVLEPLVYRPWFTGRTSAAVLVRKVDAERPTLLLDESDAAFSGEREYAEALRGILNCGYRVSGKASLCVGQGANISYKDFSVFGAKCIAGIGELPPTVADRAIRIELKRKTSDEVCRRWRGRDGWREASRMHDAVAAWARCGDVLAALRDARPAAPAGLGDRQVDVAEPLLAIADLAGGVWPQRARAALTALAGAAEDTDIVVELLKDIADVLRSHRSDVIKSSALLERLVAREDGPWREWRKGQPMTARGLARLLGPIGIHPAVHSVEDGQVRGYRVDAFGDAFLRYLPLQVSMCHSGPSLLTKSAISMCQPNETADACKSSKQPDFIEEMTHGHIDPGGSGGTADEDGHERF